MVFQSIDQALSPQVHRSQDYCERFFVMGNPLYSHSIIDVHEDDEFGCE